MDEKQFEKIREDLGNIYFELNFMRKHQKPEPTPAVIVLTCIIVSMATTLILLKL